MFPITKRTKCSGFEQLCIDGNIDPSLLNTETLIVDFKNFKTLDKDGKYVIDDTLFHKRIFDVKLNPSSIVPQYTVPQMKQIKRGKTRRRRINMKKLL
jgi:hypothetical protein